MKALQSGQTLLDRYVLAAPLGTGAGGETWRAEGPRGPVAIKVVRAGQDLSAGAFQDLIREAGVLRTLRSPHIVEYLEFSDRPDEGCAFLVTALVPGGDLAKHVQARGPYETRAVARLGLQLVTALEALHGVNILHRDLKPHNVLVTPRADDDPLLQVTDFGISRRAVHGVVDTVDLKLSPAYASPEQHQGAALSFATDIYGLAAVLWWMASGVHPDPNLPYQSGGLPPLPEAPDRADEEIERAHLGGLIGRMMHASPDGRPDLAAVRQALAGLAHGVAPVALDEGVRAPAASPRTTPDRSTVTTAHHLTDAVRPGKGRWTTVAFGVLGLGLVGTIGLGLVGTIGLDQLRRPSSPPVEQAPVPPATAVTEPPEKPEPVAAVAQPASPEPPAASPPAAVPPAPAHLRVNSVPWSQVHVDGARIGRTRDGGATFDLNAGTHTISLRSSDGLRFDKRVTFRADQTASLCVNLRTQTELSCR